MTKIQQAIIVINSFSIGIMLPIFNLLLLERGSSLQTLPLLLAIYSTTVLCLELPSGIFADIHGRKEVFLLSCGFQFISFAILIEADDMLWLIAAIIFLGAGRAFSSGSLDAIFIDQAIEKNGEGCLAGVTARMAILDGVGLAAGGIAGGVLASAAGSYLANIILRMVFSATLFIMVAIFVKEQSVHKAKTQIALSEHISQGKQVIRSTPRFLLLFIGVFFTGIFLSVIEAYWQPAFLQIPAAQNSIWMLGVITFLGFMVVALGNMIVQKLMDKYRSNWWNIYNLCRIIFAVCIVDFALQKGRAGFVICYAAIYLLLGASNVAESTLINKLTPNHMRASVLSLSSLTIQIGALCASVFSSIMILRLKFTGMWIVAGVLMGAYAVIVAAATNKSKDENRNKIDFEG